jgi:hypothetical protein
MYILIVLFLCSVDVISGMLHVLTSILRSARGKERSNVANCVARYYRAKME